MLSCSYKDNVKNCQIVCTNIRYMQKVTKVSGKARWEGREPRDGVCEDKHQIMEREGWWPEQWVEWVKFLSKIDMTNLACIDPCIPSCKKSSEIEIEYREM